jgi:hypothetical protein
MLLAVDERVTMMGAYISTIAEFLVFFSIDSDAFEYFKKVRPFENVM